MRDDILISTAEAQRLLGGVSKMWIWRHRQADPDFPAPVRFASGGPLAHWRGELIDYAERHRLSPCRPEPEGGVNEGIPARCAESDGEGS